MSYIEFHIGKYRLAKAKGKLWIIIVEGDREGEGGEFKESEFEKAIDKFYDEKF